MTRRYEGHGGISLFTATQDIEELDLGFIAEHELTNDLIAALDVTGKSVEFIEHHFPSWSGRDCDYPEISDSDFGPTSITIRRDDFHSDEDYDREGDRIFGEFSDRVHERNMRFQASYRHLIPREKHIENAIISIVRKAGYDAYKG